jgi:hypothetical protein
MSHASSDAVMDPVRACPHSLQFRLGIQFRIPNRAPPSLASLLPARYLRIQVASPPPNRVDGSSWQSGLRVHDHTENGRKFDASDPTWRQAEVFPLEGISPLDQPAPETLVLDQWLAVRSVPPTAAIPTTFTLTVPSLRSVGMTNHFLSVPYPAPVVDGKELKVAGVTYFCEEVLSLTGEAKDWIAVSFDRFWPPERASADYIVAVDACPKTETGANDNRVPWKINPWW